MTPLERDALPGALLDPLIERLKAEVEAFERGQFVAISISTAHGAIDALTKCREALLMDEAPATPDLIALARECGAACSYREDGKEVARVMLDRDQLAAFAARIAPPAGEGWQPIETAPKAGLIDIWTDRRHIDCYYDSICDEYRCITAGHLIRLKDAKLWMASPPAPAAIAAGKETE